MLAGLGGLVGGSWVHQLHRASLPLLAFGWASLALAHGWSQVRHRGGGLLWVSSILWLSTWTIAGSTVITALEEGLLGHEGERFGLNWPHLAQQGLSAAYVVLLAVAVGRALGWWRLEPAWQLGRLLLAGGRQARIAAGSLVLMAAGVGLAASAGVIAANLT